MIGEEALTGLAGALLTWQRTPDDRLQAMMRGIHETPATFDVAKLRRETLGALNAAEPFWMSRSIEALVLGAAETVPPLVIQSEHSPVPNGFLWFADPLPIDLGIDVRVHACHWFTASLDRQIGVIIHAYGGPVPDGQLPLLAISSSYFGVDRLADRDGPAVNPADVAPITALEQVFVAFLMFIQQEVLGTELHRIENKGARRRIAAMVDRDDPMFRVVELRRAREAPPEAGHTVEWQHQWLVSGHWRRQWLPSRGTHEPRWIAPYVKGDPSKPFKPPTRRLFVVRR